MIVTKNFVYIHLERTGGTLFRTFLLEHFPEAVEIGYHYPRALLPAEHANLPIIGFVRNPWDWYVSFFFHKARMENLPILEMGFENLTRAFLFLNKQEPVYIKSKRIFEHICPESIVGNKSMGVTKKELREFTSQNMGFYSWLFQRMFADRAGATDDVIFGRFENLAADAASLLERVGVDFTPKMKAYFSNAQRLNKTEHADFRTYYNAELRDEVQKQESAIIEKFNYRFE
jgi:hypothetical protein